MWKKLCEYLLGTSMNSYQYCRTTSKVLFQTSTVSPRTDLHRLYTSDFFLFYCFASYTLLPTVLKRIWSIVRNTLPPYRNLSSYFIYSILIAGLDGLLYLNILMSVTSVRHFEIHIQHKGILGSSWRPGMRLGHRLSSWVSVHRRASRGLIDGPLGFVFRSKCRILVRWGYTRS